MVHEQRKFIHETSPVTKHPLSQNILHQKTSPVTKHPLSQSIPFHKTSLSQNIPCHKTSPVTRLPLSQSIPCHKTSSITKHPLSRNIPCPKISPIFNRSIAIKYFLWASGIHVTTVYVMDLMCQVKSLRPVYCFCDWDKGWVKKNKVFSRQCIDCSNYLSSRHVNMKLFIYLFS